jgi:hypothetical protein
MGDVEDPYLMAAFPLGEFAYTEKGKWVEENVLDRVLYCQPDPNHFGYKIMVYGEFTSPEAETYFLLKYADKKDINNR